MVYRRFLFIVITAFLLRGIFILAVGSNPTMYSTPDSPGYLRLAHNLATHGQFSSSESAPFAPDTVRTPGYPFFLALLGANETRHHMAVVWTHALLGALTAGLLFLTGHRLWKTTQAATTAGVGLALDYVVILYSSFIMTEPVFLILLVLSMLFFAEYLQDSKCRALFLILSAVSAGLCAMVRPVNLYYFFAPVAALLYVAWQKRDLAAVRAGLLFAIVALAIPFAWMFRNKCVAGAWTFTTIQGLTRAAILEERLHHTTYDESTAILEARFKQEHPNGFASAAQEASAKSLWATAYVLAYPKDYAIVLLQESIRLIAGNGMKASAWMLMKDPEYDPYHIVVHPKENNQTQANMLASRHPSLGVALVVYLSLLASVYLLALFGVFSKWKESPAIVVWLLLTMAYFFAVSIGFGTGARYRIPLMPAMFLLAGAGVESVRRFFAKGKDNARAMSV